MKITKKLMTGICTLALALMAQNLWAVTAQDFTAESFTKDRDSGAAVVVDIYADWCPTCKKQATDLTKILKDKSFKNVKLYKLDYDQKDLVQEFSKLIDRPIPRQSTIVVFKNKKLKEFSVAQTGEELVTKITEALKN
ncbi:thioredoxin family protein [bacterium]|nr:thioredoxin family protein [bacterium]